MTDLVFELFLKSLVEVDYLGGVAKFQMSSDLLELCGVLLCGVILVQLYQLAFLVSGLIQVAKGFLKLPFKLIVVVEDGLDGQGVGISHPLLKVLMYSQFKLYSSVIL